MMIRSINVSESVNGTEVKHDKKQLKKIPETLVKSCIKRRIKRNSQFKRQKSINQNGSQIDIKIVKEKRLNLKNRELHIATQTYMGTKDETEKRDCSKDRLVFYSNEKKIVSMPYSTTHSLSTPVKLVKNKNCSKH